MRLPKRLVPVPLQPIFRRLRDIAPEAARHQILLVRVAASNFWVDVIKCRRSPQVYPAVRARIFPMFKD